VTALTLSNYQLWFNNITLGDGTPFNVQNISGIEDLPIIRSQDDDRGYQDGMFSGNDFLGGRFITVNLLVLPYAGKSAQYNLNLLQRAFIFQKTGTQPLQFQLTGDSGLQFVNARVRGIVTPVNQEYSYQFISTQIKFFCPDPRIYDNTQQFATLLAANPIGRTFNTVYPLVYGGGSSAGTGLVANAGYVDTFPTITITGPAVNPFIGNLTTGLTMYFNLTLNTGDVLVIDTLNKTITLNGNPARNYLSGLSKWFNAPAGNNTFFFSASGASGTTSAQVSWYNAYV
jgi:Phage tail protein